MPLTRAAYTLYAPGRRMFRCPFPPAQPNNSPMLTFLHEHESCFFFFPAVCQSIETVQ